MHFHETRIPSFEKHTQFDTLAGNAYLVGSGGEVNKCGARSPQDVAERQEAPEIASYDSKKSTHDETLTIVISQPKKGEPCLDEKAKSQHRHDGSLHAEGP